MPIPKPHDDEQQDDFMQRCMSDNIMIKEYPHDDQRAAICRVSWKKNNHN